MRTGFNYKLICLAFSAYSSGIDFILEIPINLIAFLLKQGAFFH